MRYTRAFPEALEKLCRGEFRCVFLSTNADCSHAFLNVSSFFWLSSDNLQLWSISIWTGAEFLQFCLCAQPQLLLNQVTYQRKWGNVYEMSVVKQLMQYLLLKCKVPWVKVKTLHFNNMFDLKCTVVLRGKNAKLYHCVCIEGPDNCIMLLTNTSGLFYVQSCTENSP